MALSPQEKKELAQLLEVRQALTARSNLFEFTKHTFLHFQPNWFHENYYKQLDRFAKGEIKKLMIFVPPQHGKSEGSTRRLPAYLLGLNPDLKIAIISYSADKARKFNRELQRLFDETKYQKAFPNVKLSTSADGYARTQDEFEIVGHRGGVKTVGVGGALTGEPVDVLIIDDIYKDAETAWSATQRDKIQDWYNSVAETRLHNDSRTLVVFTRWHEADLAGYLLAQEREQWEVITYPAIKVGEPTEYDPREDGEPLWPERHNLEKLERIRQRDPFVFGNLYQQDPKSKEGLLYEKFKEWEVLPATATKNYAVIDTADTGSDFLCCIIYTKDETGFYIRDVYYTQQSMEITEIETAKLITKWDVKVCYVESNNGGKGFARTVEHKCRAIANWSTRFKWYHQSLNKETRIFTKSADVQNMIHMPKGWNNTHAKFYADVMGYTVTGKNKHDDAPDTLTMIIENEIKKKVMAFAR